jgi:hypothetical protein
MATQPEAFAKLHQLDYTSLEQQMTRTMQEPRFDFFELPRELRDFVYHYLWEDYPKMKVPYSGKRNQSHYNPTINKPQLKTCINYRKDGPPLPSWLFASKTFFSEATTTFNECAEWA